MSNSELERTEIETKEVIRLKVDGARTSVNTLRDQQTARGVSLICPFPALEVNVPVAFHANGTDGPQQGSIHRIGVEDDPETGLPRLRLSIRTQDARATAVAETPLSLIAESVRKTETPDEQDSADTETDSNIPEAMTQLEENEPDSREENNTGGFSLFSDEVSQPEEMPLFDDSEPAWVSCEDVPLPEEFMERARTRRRNKVAGRAAWLAAIAVLVAGGYMLERAGVVDVKDIRSYVAGFSMDSILAKKTAEPLVEPAFQEPSAVQETSPEPSGEKDSLSPEPVIPINQPAPLEEMDNKVSDPKVVTASAVEQPQQPTVAEAPEGKQTEEKATDATADSSEEVSLLLPTRWPVEYATGYRVRNPNGVVVDVPGGLVKREGWLEHGNEHPMIRSIKVIQRETGARFIVYVHGDLPRFITSPKTGGVSLRLYHPEDNPAPSEKVALLD
ncbi:MAG: hypothetical protein GY854_26360 [Deltaproteobacteria bacterium]|nr:hypothetical protein [Deltaproteobacteria bacterium]